MRKGKQVKRFALRLQPSSMEEATKVAKTEPQVVSFISSLCGASMAGALWHRRAGPCSRRPPFRRRERLFGNLPAGSTGVGPAASNGGAA